MHSSFLDQRSPLAPWRRRAPHDPLGPGILLTPAALAKRLKSTAQAKEVAALLDVGRTYAEISAELHVSETTARRLAAKSGDAPEADLLLRAMHGDLDRETLISRLGNLRYHFHGWRAIDEDYGPLSDWHIITAALTDGFLSRAEYTAVVDLAARPAAQALSRPACDAFSCQEHEQHVYITCYGTPTLVGDRDYCTDDWIYGTVDSQRGVPNYPIRHYVGWTRSHPPVRRIRSHGAKSARFIARVIPGNTYDEDTIRAFSPCPTCGESLDYFRENPGLPDSMKFWRLLEDRPASGHADHPQRLPGI